MELTLDNNDPTKTTLSTAEGALYQVSTPSSEEETSVERIDGILSSGRVKTLIGTVTRVNQLVTKLLMCSTSTELQLQSTGGQEEGLVNSWTVIGPDRKSYRWQIFIQYPVLVVDDNSFALVARYHRAKLGIVSRSRKAFLEILTPWLKSDMIDFIVVTFVSFMKHRIGVESTNAQQPQS